MTPSNKPKGSLFSISLGDKRTLESMLNVHMEKQRAAFLNGRVNIGWGESELEVRLQNVNMSKEYASSCFLKSGMRKMGSSKSEVSVYSDGVRMVRNPDTGAEIWEQKVQNGRAVFLVPKNTRMPKAKIVLATETPIPAQRVRLERARRRDALLRRKATTKFRMAGISGGTLVAEVHLSSVESSREGSRPSTSVEVEIEFSFLAFDRNALKKSAAELCGAVRTVYDALFSGKRESARPGESAPSTEESPKKHGFLSWSSLLSRDDGTSALLREIRSEPKPHSLSKKDVLDIFSARTKGSDQRRLVGYAVTNKLDGMKVRLVLERGRRPRLAVGRGEIRRIDSAGPWKHGNCVLDCEAYRNRLWCFDVGLAHGSTRIQERGLLDRLAVAREVSSLVNAEVSRNLEVWNVEVKTFFSEGTVYENLEKSRVCVARQRSGDDGLDNDGFIFAKLAGVYKEVQWKWKPPYMQTIDMRVRKMPSGLYDLLVATSKDHAPLVYRGARTTGVAISRWQWRRVGLSEEEAGSGQIVEFSFRVSTGWEPLVWRSDKQKANYITTAQNVWDNVVNPLGERELVEMLRGLCMLSWRQFNNRKKTEVLRDFMAGGERVLDVGIGRGGDLGKFMRAGAKEIFGIDPSQENLQELRRRMQSLSARSPLKTFYLDSVKMAQGDGADLDAVASLLGRGGEHSVDLVTSMFSLTFFFDSLQSVKALVSAIDYALKPGGYFVGVTMDGTATHQLLEETAEGQKNCALEPMCITKRYRESSPLVGRTVVVDIEEEGTMVKEQTEWLVYESVLQDMLSQRGIDLMMWQPFVRPALLKRGSAELDLLGNDARRIASLQSSFAFRKSGGSEFAPPPIASPSARRLGLGSVPRNVVSGMAGATAKAAHVLGNLDSQKNWGLWSGVLRVSQLAIRASRIYFALEVSGVLEVGELARPAGGMDAPSVAMEFGRGTLRASVGSRVAASLQKKAAAGFFMNPRTVQITNFRITSEFVWYIEQAFLEARQRTVMRVVGELERGTIGPEEHRAILGAVL